MHPISKLMEKWWHDHAAKHDDPEWKKYLDRYGELLKIKHEELLAEHVNTSDGAKCFGMSGAGSCTRKAALKMLGFKGEPFSGSTLTTFQIGHMVEVMALTTLEMVGCKIRGFQAETKIGKLMASFSDGIIESGPGITEPVVLSVKSCGYKMSAKRKGEFIRMGFSALVANGMRAEFPSWWVQIQAELYGHGILNGLLIAVAKDMVRAMEGDPKMSENGSLTFYGEVIPLDSPFVEKHLLPVWQATAKAVADKKAGAPVVFTQTGRFAKLTVPGDVGNGWGGPNKEITGTFNPCFGCDLAAACRDNP